MDYIAFLDERTRALAEKTCELSDNIWEAAETAFEETKSCKYLCDYLASEGFTVEIGTGGMPTAFTAVFGSGRPRIGLLAEYDALHGLSQEAGLSEAKPLIPGGNGHGCGHNLLGSGCAHAAVLIKHYLEETGKPGTVILYGCPAEEGGSGKTRLAGKGAFNDLDCALSWHPGEYAGAVSASTMANVQANYHFTGKASHAATSPFVGRSALDAVELMNVGANYLREHIPPGSMLHYAVLNTGGASPNVVQAQAESVYLIRGTTVDDAVAVKERVDKIAGGAAMMTETSVDIEFDKACSHYLPNFVLGDVITDAIREVGMPAFDEEDLALAEAIRTTTPGKTESTGMASALILPYVPASERPRAEEALIAPINTYFFPHAKLNRTVPGSTDVGDVSLNCPVSWFMYVTCAQGTPGHSWQMVSQGKSGLAHKGMLQAAKVLALSAIQLFEAESLLTAAREEFLMKTAGKLYVCPIPEEAL